MPPLRHPVSFATHTFAHAWLPRISPALRRVYACRYASIDAQLKQKAEARRALEDLIFDMTDEASPANSHRARAAEEADAWLQNFDAITVEEIHAKYRQLRSM